ncbi:hypothetical protein [Holdemania massiliensis]|uniref:hypothetical protein n=1 Tax=Holdemania massiliensis TaxID=1468449 RepID=UPI002675AC05|nr:hypothetical protein [Holdemania massiliensis]
MTFSFYPDFPEASKLELCPQLRYNRNNKRCPSLYQLIHLRGSMQKKQDLRLCLHDEDHGQLSY